MAAPAEPTAAPAAADDDDKEEEGFASSGLLAESVNKDEWKGIEASLSHQKKTVQEMLKRACSQIRTKGELTLDDSNGKFLGDMLPEMADFSAWCYKVPSPLHRAATQPAPRALATSPPARSAPARHQPLSPPRVLACSPAAPAPSARQEHIRPKLLSLSLPLPDEEAADDKKKKGGGGGKKGGGGGKKGGDKIPAKTQIKIDNVMRIMAGESAKDKGKKGVQVGDKAIGWLEALEAGKNLVVDAPWELQLAKEMGNAAALLNKKKTVEGEKDTEESRFRSVRNLADAVVVYETQYKLRFFGKDDSKDVPPMQILDDARHTLTELKKKVKFTVDKCMRKHPALLSSSEFKKRHASKFLQPYNSQTQTLQSLIKPGPRLVLLRSPPDTGKTSLAAALPELFPDLKVVFCCLARRVNLEVAQTLYNMGIPFAWVHNNNVTCSWLCGLRGASTSNSIAQMEEKLRLGVEKIQETTGGLGNSRVRKRRVQVIRAPKMFVTDVASCAWLSRQFDAQKTLLMIDEPTMGADQGDGEAMSATSLTGNMVKGMLDGPHKMIWSSATLPAMAEIPTPVSHFKTRFGVGNEHVDELVSMQLNVGVLLVKANGQVALPHAMCAADGESGAGAQTAALNDFVGRLKTEPLLVKAYTAQALVAMQDRLEEDDVAALVKEAGYAVKPIDEYFADLSRLSHSSLRSYALEILEQMAKTKHDGLIKAFCTSSSKKANAMFPPFSAAKLLLDNACYFPGMTLTVSHNPMAQIGETAEALVKEMPSLKKLGKEMEAAEAAVEKQLAAVRKEAEKVKGGEDRVEEIVAAKLRDMNIVSTGSLKIPEHCVVNSRAHMRKYNDEKSVGDYDASFFRNLPTQSNFKAVAQLSVDEKWQMLLLSGVAAHMPLEPALNPAGDTGYTNYVAEQMEKGALAVCGVTKDFTYGANVPCTSVLVDKDFLAKHSANTLRQFIGRVARTGLAPYGVAQFEDDSFLPKMCGKTDDQEAACMEATAKVLLAAPTAEAPAAAEE